MATGQARGSIVDDEKYRRFEHVISLYIYYMSRKLERARKQLDRPEATSQVLNETLDEITARLAELEIAVVAARRERGAKAALEVIPRERDHAEKDA